MLCLFEEEEDKEQPGQRLLLNCAWGPFARPTSATPSSSVLGEGFARADVGVSRVARKRVLTLPALRGRAG